VYGTSFVTTAAAALVRRGRRLAGATLVYNTVEVVLALVAGLSAGSIALVGFGVDSFIELAASAIALWRLEEEQEPDGRSEAEPISAWLVGVSFLLLGAYLALRAFMALLNQEAPETSALGIAIALVSLVVMPLLVREKRRVAEALGSEALKAEWVQTLLGAWLSAILLGGLVLRAAFGWWWADPVAALLMTPIIVREGLETLRSSKSGARQVPPV
jgi:cation diffusion facilitator family transporter